MPITSLNSTSEPLPIYLEQSVAKYEIINEVYLEQDMRFNLQSQSLPLTLYLWMLGGDGVLDVLNLLWL